MLVGYPPFFADEPSVTCQKILHWKKTFQIPKDHNLSPEAKDLLTKLIADADVRLGRNGAQEIKSHAFFRGFNWEGLQQRKAPFIPSVQSEVSNENFDQFDEEPVEQDKRHKHRKVDMKFIGYTYKADVEEQKQMLVKVLKDLGQIEQERNAY